MTVAVTGATGHVGANLIRSMVGQGHQVRAVVHGAWHGLYGVDVEIARADVRDIDSLRTAFDGCEMVFHLAARISIIGDPDGALNDINVAGVRNAAQAALDCKVRRFVHCSSIHAFDLDHKDGPITEESPRATRATLPPYDRSKNAGEQELHKLIAQGLDAVIINPTGIIGPQDPRPSRVGEVMLDLYERNLPALVSGGFDWVDVRDVVIGLMAAAERGTTGENYIIGGDWASVTELANLAASVTGKRRPRLVCPMFLARLAAPFALWTAERLNVEPLFTPEGLHALRANQDIRHDKAARELGYAPRPLEDTIGDVYRWFAAAGFITNSTLQPALPSTEKAS